MSGNRVRPGSEPRPYSGGQNKIEPKFRMRHGFSKVNTLFLEYTNFPRRSAHWEFKGRVIKLASKILGSFGAMNWFLFQDLNDSLHSQNVNFIKDTLRFIATGRRRISIHSWPMLVTSDYASGVGEDTSIGIREHMVSIDLDIRLDNDELIQKWLSHPKGFDDLMYTMNILFGSRPEAVKG